MLDLGVAGAGLVALAPLMLGVAVGSALWVGWPPLYVAERVGRHGRRFKHVKFRSMLAGESCGRVFFEQARLNAYGRFIRRYHLDELPELWLIWRGEMSLVGPRPLPAFLLEGLDTRLREQVPPGWTGPAQLHLLRYGRLSKEEQLRLDAHYVATRSLVSQVAWLVKTAGVILGRRAPLDLGVATTAARRDFGRRWNKGGRRE